MLASIFTSILGPFICAVFAALLGFSGWLWYNTQKEAQRSAKKDLISHSSFTKKVQFNLADFVTPTAAEKEAYKLWQKLNQTTESESLENASVPSEETASTPVSPPAPEPASPPAPAFTPTEEEIIYSEEMAGRQQASFKLAQTIFDSYRELLANPITEPGNRAFEQNQAGLQKAQTRAQRLAVLQKTPGLLVDLTPTEQAGVYIPRLQPASAITIPVLDFGDEEDYQEPHCYPDAEEPDEDDSLGAAGEKDDSHNLADIG